MPELPLEHRLAASGALKSLVAEQHVCAVLADAGWSALHGSFYVDGVSGKVREMDIMARQVWVRALKRRVKRLELYMPCEIKSAKDFSALFAPAEGILIGGYLQRQWIGYQGPVRNTILRGLRKIGLSADQLSAFANQCNSIAYPRDSAAPLELMVDPPACKWVTTAFRETNTNIAKGLDESVLWKAGQALRSGTRALRRRWLRFHISEIVETSEYTLSVGRDALGAALEEFADGVAIVAQFHPVVVLDSRLWIVSGKELTEIPWCRFVQIDHFGNAQWWFDVVHFEALRAYVAEITAGYAQSLRAVRARLVPTRVRPPAHSNAEIIPA